MSDYENRAIAREGLADAQEAIQEQASNHYRVTADGELVMHTPDVKVAYRTVADLLAGGHLAPRTELRITLVTNPDSGRSRRENTVSLNWTR